MCVNNLPRVALDSETAEGIRIRDLLIASPAPYRNATGLTIECRSASRFALHGPTVRNSLPQSCTGTENDGEPADYYIALPLHQIANQTVGGLV